MAEIVNTRSSGAVRVALVLKQVLPVGSCNFQQFCSCPNLALFFIYDQDILLSYLEAFLKSIIVHYKPPITSFSILCAGNDTMDDN